MINKVSIIIPVYNASDIIEECLQAIYENLKNKNIEYEVIIINDGSTDRTGSAAESFIKDRENFFLFTIENSGPAYARNLGAEKSRYDVMIFLDSDCFVTENWINEILKPFNKLSDIAAVGGGIRPYEKKNNIFSLYEQQRRDNLYKQESRFIEFLPACNFAVKKNIFNQMKGFDTDYKNASFEDYDFCQRIRDKGYKIYYNANAYIIHKHSINIKGILKRAYLHGKESILYRKKHKCFLYQDIYCHFMNYFLMFKNIKRFPFLMCWIAFLYEIFTRLGEIIGIIKYRILKYGIS